MDPGRPGWSRGAPKVAGVTWFREQKAKIFLALLGKQYGATPNGWRAAAGDYGRAGTHMSIADVVDKGSLEQVREYEKKMKAAARSSGRTAKEKA